MSGIRQAAKATALVAGLAGLVLGTQATAQAAQRDETYAIAVIGDVPYGGMLIEHFPAFIGQINADPDVRMVTHLGDIKNGSSVCSDDYFNLNVRYTRNGISFAALNIPGSNNSTLPWSGLGYTAPTAEQLAEVSGRTAADLALLDDVFAQAKADGNRAVVLQIQADMFDPTVTDPSWSDYSAFQPIVRKIVEESNAFAGPVYLLNGDSHVYNVDQPLATGSSWLSFYGVTGAAGNLTRITVNGSSPEKGWLKVTTHSIGAPLTWETVPAS